MHVEIIVGREEKLAKGIQGKWEYGTTPLRTCLPPAIAKVTQDDSLVTVFSV